jgi:hypothetical protein
MFAERPIGERDPIKTLGLHATGRNRPGFGVYIDFIIALKPSAARISTLAY